MRAGITTGPGRRATRKKRVVSVLPPSLPPPATGKYRYEHHYLFQSVPYDVEPARTAEYAAAGASGYDRASVCPDDESAGSGMYWEATHGDYIDANGVRQGAVVTLLAPLNSGAVEYSLDATAIVQQAQTGDRWLAMKWSVSPLTTRRVYAKNSSFPPRVDVTYTDGSTATLACRITAASSTSTSNQNTDATDYNLNPALLTEFERPTQPVQSATLVIRISSTTSTNTNFRAWLLDPRVNTSLAQQGIAQSQALDAGLLSHADVVVCHRYVDAAVGDTSNFVAGLSFNADAQASFDPAIFGEGPTDLTKLPHAALTTPSAYTTGHRYGGLNLTPPAVVPVPFGDAQVSVEFIPSSYAGQGFTPLAPGMGAMKWRMVPSLDENGAPLHDGSLVGSRGSGGSGRIYFDEAKFGNVDDIYVRSYIRIGTPDGGPFVDSITDRYQVHENESASTGAPLEIAWLPKGGKWMMVPDHHCFPQGGFSQGSGGPYGWQARMGWGTCDEQEGGPLEGGHRFTFHEFDFLKSQPGGNFARNYTYQNNRGMRTCGYGGMNVLYAHKWYCFEVRHKLNTVLPYYPGFIDDGMMQVWLDGRLVITKRNIVLRSWPVWRGLNSVAHSTAFGLNQFAAITATGFANGEGYVGAWVRHNRVHGSGMRGYGAVLSRYSATQAVVGLVRRSSNRHLALSDPIDWADGDELRIEANGTAPTVITIKRNGTPITLKWYTGATGFPLPSGATDDPNAFPNPASTSLQSATSYSDSSGASQGTEGSTSNLYVGFFAMNNHETNGLRITSWTGGEIGGASVSDSFSYSDADLTTANSAYRHCDPSSSSVCPLVVRSGAVISDPIHRLSRSANMLSVRTIGARNLLFNWFHGGQQLNADDRYLFITGVVAATSYIGPMNTGT